MMSTLGQGDFELAVRQQPKYACVAIERKPIDPPPIVQLMVNPRKDPSRTFLQNPYLILTARLIRKGDEDQDEQSGPKESDLTGTLVSSLYSLKDTDNSQGGFFVFGDLSVRRVGTYRLAFILYELKLAEKECWLLSRTVSDPFVVYATKTFPGLAESTFLTRSFSDQGVRLRLRKDSRTVSTKKRTISQTDHIRTSQGIHGYLPHDANHDLSPNGHSPHHHLRRLSTLHDQQSQLDRSRNSMGSQGGSYYSESPQMRPGEYTSSTYGYAGYDEKPHKRARMDGSGTAPDSPHTSAGGGGGGYETDTTAYHPYAHHQHHQHHAHAGPRTVPDPLTSIYPFSATTSYSLPSQPALVTTGLPSMPSPYTAMLPRLDTSGQHHHHQQQHHHSNNMPPHSPAPGSATSAFSPGSGGGARRSPPGYHHPYQQHHHQAGGGGGGGGGAAAMFTPTSLPYHHSAGHGHHHAHHHHHHGASGLGIALPGLELDGGER
ncbi:velvet factor-domain-containing protein [Chaetomidium leptoderma]|uniref:Velvet factor-domain-containing protein n=1 Tax=Chaetomidium leptoderma TaxID=669021 RepID=A0AAN6ZTH6_9PEZI|nr:velvet factor-domain-containing protein [Chaetomidium leptoderma]